MELLILHKNAQTERAVIGIMRVFIAECRARMSTRPLTVGHGGATLLYRPEGGGIHGGH